jgi:hypothetical protein
VRTKKLDFREEVELFAFRGSEAIRYPVGHPAGAERP